MEDKIPNCKEKECRQELKKCVTCKQEFRKCSACEKKFEEGLKCLKCGEKLTDKYFWDRIIILFILIFEIVLLFFNTYCGWGLIHQLDKYLFCILTGLFGLLFRNCIWLSGNNLEIRGKKVLYTYLLHYQFFVILSSILISSVLMLIGKIENSPYLFFTFALPLNIYVGLETYRAIDFLKGLVGKNS